MKNEFKISTLFITSIGLTFLFAILFSTYSIVNYLNVKNKILKKRASQSRHHETVNLIIGDFNEDDADENVIHHK